MGNDMGNLLCDAHVDGIGEALREVGGEGGGGPGETLEGDGELVVGGGAVVPPPVEATAFPDKVVYDPVLPCVRLSGRVLDERGASNPGAPSSGRPLEPWSSAGALASGVRKADIDLLDAQDSQPRDTCMHACMHENSPTHIDTTQLGRRDPDRPARYHGISGSPPKRRTLRL